LSDIAVITGTTHGIGRVTSLELARAGRTVVMLCRDVRAANLVRDQIIAAVPGARISVIACDLASLASVREAAARVRGQFGRIALLVNNAGMVSTRRQMTTDGFERTFAVNHLGPFLLTSLLLDSIAQPGRIVNLASRVHYRGTLDLNTVVNEQARYGARAAYAQSKLANVLHTFALARRMAGTRITANCLHPGVVATNLLPRWLRMVKPLISRRILDVERASKTTLYLALSEDVARTSGRYFDQNQIEQMASSAAYSVALQEALWRASELWVGLERDAFAAMRVAPQN
jgi:NAD(P)-dependent dehydrogenase (short-subunit alcohol dehydrogenase family)